MRFNFVFAAAVVLATFAAASQAMPVAYTIKGYTTAFVAMNGYPNAAFSWTFFGDTNKRTGLGGDWAMAFDSSALTVAGNTIVPSVIVGVARSAFGPTSLVFADPYSFGGFTLSDPVLATFDGTDPLGPIAVALTDTTPLPLGDFVLVPTTVTLAVSVVPEPTLPTTGGPGAQNPATPSHDIAPVPEPAALALAGFALLGAARLIRRRKAAA
jgi:hypothetical protein